MAYYTDDKRKKGPRQKTLSIVGPNSPSRQAQLERSKQRRALRADRVKANKLEIESRGGLTRSQYELLQRERGDMLKNQPAPTTFNPLAPPGETEQPVGPQAPLAQPAPPGLSPEQERMALDAAVMRDRDAREADRFDVYQRNGIADQFKARQFAAVDNIIATIPDPKRRSQIQATLSMIQQAQARNMTLRQYEQQQAQAQAQREQQELARRKIEAPVEQTRLETESRERIATADREAEEARGTQDRKNEVEDAKTKAERDAEAAKQDLRGRMKLQRQKQRAEKKAEQRKRKNEVKDREDAQAHDKEMAKTKGTDTKTVGKQYAPRFRGESLLKLSDTERNAIIGGMADEIRRMNITEDDAGFQKAAAKATEDGRELTLEAYRRQLLEEKLREAGWSDV